MKKSNFKLITFILLISLALICVNVTINAAKRVELKVEVFDRGIPGYQADNNYWTKWIQKNFGDPNNIDVKFVTVLRAEEVQKLNVLMATGEAPDIVFVYTPEIFYNYAKQGGLTDVGALLDRYGKDLKKYLGPDCLQMGIFNAKQYAIPAKRVLTGTFASFIRKDWLDKLGLPIPKTRDEWYNALKAFKEKDPGNVGKDKVIPLALNLDPQNATWGARVLIDSFVKEMDFYEEQTIYTLYWLKPGFKEGIRFLNKMYNEGLISPEFALDRDAKMSDRDTAQGRVGSMMCNFDYPYRTTPGLVVELQKNVPGASFVPVDCFINANGNKRKRLYTPNGFFMMIPKTSKRAVEAIKYLNWMSDPKVIDFLTNGEKGTNYTELKEGIPVNILVEGEKRLTTDICIILNGKDYGSLERNITALSLSYVPGLQELIKQAYKQSIDGNKPYYELSFPIDSYAKYRTTILEKDAEIYVKTLTCKPADFDSVYDKLVDEYNNAYGKEVMAERAAYLKVNFKNKK